VILDYFNRRPVNFAHTSHDGTPILKIDRGFLFTFAAALLIFIAGCTNANSEPQKSKEKAAGVIPDESVGSSPKNTPSTASPSNDALSKDSVPASVSSPQTAPTDWLQFRGAGNLSTTSSQGLPSEFNENHVTWKAELLGRGCSTPIIVGNRVLLTSYSGYGESAAKPGALDLFLLHLYCYDRETGELFWRKDIKGNPAENPRLNPNLLGHGFASSTPVSGVSEKSLEQAWFYFPRMLQSSSIVMTQRQFNGPFETLNRLQVEKLTANRSVRRAA